MCKVPAPLLVLALSLSLYPCVLRAQTTNASITGRVTDDHGDPLSRTLSEWAQDVDHVVQLHWMVSDSPHALLQPVPGSPRPSLETLVELQALTEQLRRLAARLRTEQL